MKYFLLSFLLVCSSAFAQNVPPFVINIDSWSNAASDSEISVDATIVNTSKSSIDAITIYAYVTEENGAKLKNDLGSNDMFALKYGAIYSTSKIVNWDHTDFYSSRAKKFHISSVKIQYPDHIVTYKENQLKDCIFQEDDFINSSHNPLSAINRKKESVEKGSLPNRSSLNNNKRVYDVVDEMPCFSGGNGALMSYLSSHIIYPKEAQEKGIQGRVVVSMIVNEDGSITSCEVHRSVDPLLDKEALRVVKSMPKWTPGKSNGVPVKVKYTFPVAFRLQ